MTAFTDQTVLQRLSVETVTAVIIYGTYFMVYAYGINN